MQTLFMVKHIQEDKYRMKETQSNENIYENNLISI